MTYICGVPDRCPVHGEELHGYHCHDCQVEWQAGHPRTVDAIARLVRGELSTAQFRAISKAER